MVFKSMKLNSSYLSNKKVFAIVILREEIIISILLQENTHPVLTSSDVTLLRLPPSLRYRCPRAACLVSMSGLSSVCEASSPCLVTG